MKKDCVYILKCADGTLYTGWTNDLEHRLKMHNSGKGAKYTKARLPVKLVYSEEHEDKISAMRREAAIKKLSRKEKEKLIEDYVALLSSCRQNKLGCKKNMDKLE